MIRQLPPCSELANCVSTQASHHDPLHRVEPLAFKAEPTLTMRLVLQVLARERGLRILERDDGYVHAVVTSRVLRIRHDIELAIDHGAGMLHLRSASRLRLPDLGSNRRRAVRVLAGIDQAIRGLG
jgi:uncharacterized protein (DUF1499 family)